MPKDFEFSAELPHAVREVHAALTDERYWRWRMKDSDRSVVVIDKPYGPETLRVTVTDRTDLADLPAIVRGVLRRPLVSEWVNEWGRLDGDTSRGRITGGATGGVPFRIESRSRLRAIESRRTRFDVRGQVAVNVPVVGGQIELLVRQMILRSVAADQDVLDGWLTDEQRG